MRVFWFILLLTQMLSSGATFAETSVDLLPPDFPTAMPLEAPAKMPLPKNSDEIASIRRINYQEIIEETLKVNLDILLSSLNQEVAFHQLQREQHAFLPSIGAGAGFFRNSGQTQDAVGRIFRDITFYRYDPHISLNFSLNVGEQLHLSRAAESEYQGAQFQLSNTRQEALLAISELYQVLLLSRAGVKIAEQLAQNSKDVFEIVKARTEAGVALAADLRLAQAKLASDREQVVVATNEWVQASIRLARVLRRDPRVILLPSETLSPQPSVYEVLEPVDLPLQVAERPDVRAAKWTSTAAEEQKAAAKWDFWGPSLAVEAIYLQLGDRLTELRQGERLFAGVFWDFSLAGWDQIKVQSRRADVARIQFERINDQARAEISGATRDIEAALDRMPLASESVTAAEQTIDLTLDRYRAGKTILIDVLVAQDRLAQAQLSLARAITAYNLAQVNYLAAVGQLESEQLFQLIQIQSEEKKG
jgi:outer membrane protein TolC